MRVAIAGYGVEGKSNLAYWMRRGDDVTIVDEREVIDDVPVGVPTLCGEGVLARLDGFDMVVRTASMAPSKISTHSPQVKIWSATNEFFAQCPASIVGVTGTKGKGTTSSLIVSMLRAAGRTVHLVGNIGVPALDILPEIAADDIVVYELSSFQLWDLERSPHVAVVLPIEPDHLDVHSSYDEYVGAKANIARYQTVDDVMEYYQANADSQSVADQSPASTKIAYPYPTDLTDVLVIPGEHNRDNACAAIAAARQFGIDDDAIRQGLHDFTGLPHRIKFIRELDGVRYYDDNYSSAPAATIAAMRSFDVPEVLIVGGYDRELDLQSMTRSIADQHNIHHIIVIGQTGERIGTLLSGCGRHNWTRLEGKPSMHEIVMTAREHAIRGSVVIMSPGCASFDMFRDFVDRGDQFVAEVERLS